MYDSLNIENSIILIRKKLLYTQKVYRAMQKQFSELRNGNIDLTFEEMWDYCDKLDDLELILVGLKTKLLLPYHLLDGLNKIGFDQFYMPAYFFG